MGGPAESVCGLLLAAVHSGASEPNLAPAPRLPQALWDRQQGREAMERANPGWLGSLIYNLLVATVSVRELRVVGRLWTWAWQASNRRFRGAVRTTLHGCPAVVNFGYAYPIVARLCRTLNQPLVELVYQCSRARGGPVDVIDVGAAVGDTMFLLLANCPGMIGEFYCVDGDAEFFRYLQMNLGNRPNGKLFHALLSSHEGTEKPLIRLHEGTASAQGDGTVRCSTLDAIIMPLSPRRVDVIKVDVDGLDGAVLKGAARLIKTFRPAVVFEWYPSVYRQTGHSLMEPFEILASSGYCQFIWFNKFGIFSHISDGRDQPQMALLAEICLRNLFRNEWHYDVVALHESSPVSSLELAEASFARARRSDF
jgi:FkbM family methyltransferase